MHKRIAKRREHAVAHKSGRGAIQQYLGAVVVRSPVTCDDCRRWLKSGQVEADPVLVGARLIADALVGLWGEPFRVRPVGNPRRNGKARIVHNDRIRAGECRVRTLNHSPVRIHCARRKERPIRTNARVENARNRREARPAQAVKLSAWNGAVGYRVITGNNHRRYWHGRP